MKCLSVCIGLFFSIDAIANLNKLNMRKFIICFLFATANNLHAQQLTNKEPQINKDYFKKSKNQKRTGWILLGGGATIFTGGAIAMQHSNSKGGNEVPFILGGMAMAVSSAPFLISSAVNKHKARLELRKQSVLITPNNINQTSVSLKIDL